MSVVTTRYVEAAGGIIYRKRNTIDSSNTSDLKKTSNQANMISDDDFELCLVYRPKYDDWSWPKGKNEPKESHRHTAVREVGEETGYAVTLGPHIAQIEYPLENEGKKSISKSGAKNSSQNNNKTEVVKRIHYWMMREIDENAAMKRLPAFGPIKPAKPTEIGNVIWLTPSKARKKLTHDSDRKVLDAFLEKLHASQTEYKTLILVRHGKAESRKSWQGSEATRPITPLGSAASYALGRELACYAPNRIVSSPWKRCVETVATFAHDSSLSIEQIAELTEDHHENKPKSTLSVLISEIQNLDCNAQNTQNTEANINNSIVMCLHRPIIGTFFDYLRGITKPRAHKRILSQKSPYMPTGSAIVLHISNTSKGARIIDIEKVLPIVY
ncbi:NUDIX hydrolase [Gardnerella vaginalis]|uniref:NUDIX hydrolase n=1 Tax=Gardnerella vaginalis TaxID=2702 RepID=UPI0002635CB0|nr:NUDIX hydrolase [Gardnerella vaginalis]EIK74417.1 MutT1 protein [Gardnerella vaginalis 75712]OKY56182.1 bifunctional RNase H/acid phosphatase [Gardnerella vaginalis]UQA87835.1 NUDIX hydrolase [Gardnerella vaginalis]